MRRAKARFLDFCPNLDSVPRVSMPERNAMKRLLSLVFALCLALPALAANPQIEMKTSMGTLTIELFADKAPKTVENFLQYAKDGHYAGTIFHRVIDGFMIQGGGFEPGMKQRPARDPIKNEADNGLKNETGTLAMARTSDPHSATAQFFINVADNTFLNHTSASPHGWGYAVFGKVTKGMDVLQRIAKVPTDNIGMYQNVPTQPVIIESVNVLAAK
jgi:cyclophilin family peptidyl-prolyl cis-trans isomerase